MRNFNLKSTIRIPHAFTLWNFAFGEPAAGGIPQGRSAIKLLHCSS
jgi:hypothetical protein